jgi:hypothetical protein
MNPNDPVYLSEALRGMGGNAAPAPQAQRPTDLGGGAAPVNYNPARVNDIGYGRTQESVSGGAGQSVNEVAAAAEAAAKAAAAASKPRIHHEGTGGGNNVR